MDLFSSFLVGMTVSVSLCTSLHLFLRKFKGGEILNGVSEGETGQYKEVLRGEK